MKILVTGGSGFIGTSLVTDLISGSHQVLNLDVSRPKDDSHVAYWAQVDILDVGAVTKAFTSFGPDVVVHLAARTDTDSNSVADYLVNTQGTKNILDVIQQTPSVKQAIIASTQFVNQYHGHPENDLDFQPHTAYGESKVIVEQMIRRAKLNAAWVIVRPTNIWGPWHPRYPYEFWRVLRKGYYFHPSGTKVVRSYGYVRNVTWQICQIIMKPSMVSGNVYYVGDLPIDLKDWVNGFAMLLRGRRVTVVPRTVILLLARLGDVLKSIGLRFPITTARYKSMTTSNDAPMGKIFNEFGDPPYSLEAGIAETVEWLRREHPTL